MDYLISIVVRFAKAQNPRNIQIKLDALTNDAKYIPSEENMITRKTARWALNLFFDNHWIKCCID